ncbi:MAG: YunC family protein [Fibrobacterota bacterium]
MFEGFETYRIELTLPLMILRGRRGILACGYINHHTCTALGEAAAIVTGVSSFEDMCTASVKDVSEPGRNLGIHPGMTGSEALEFLR